MASDTPTKHMYAKCLKCQARWWYMTVPTRPHAFSRASKAAICPNCYTNGNDVVIANDDEASEYKPERKEWRY